MINTLDLPYSTSHPTHQENLHLRRQTQTQTQMARRHEAPRVVTPSQQMTIQPSLQTTKRAWYAPRIGHPPKKGGDGGVSPKNRRPGTEEARRLLCRLALGAVLVPTGSRARDSGKGGESPEYVSSSFGVFKQSKAKHSLSPRPNVTHTLASHTARNRQGYLCDRSGHSSRPKYQT